MSDEYENLEKILNFLYLLGGSECQKAREKKTGTNVWPSTIFLDDYDYKTLVKTL